MSDTKYFGNGGDDSGTRPVYQPPTMRDREKSTVLPWSIVAVLSIFLLGGGWIAFALVDGAKTKAAEAEERAEAAGKKLGDLDRERSELSKRTEELAQQVQSQEAELAKLKATYDSLEAKMKDEIGSGDVELSQEGGRIRVDLVDKILFDSGEAALTERGAAVLGKLGTVLASVSDKQIQVAGHTDDSPISSRLVETFPTNWELSTARAVNVVRFLSEKGGVKPAKLVAAGHGPYDPVASNRTAKGRARNRRIEILLVPELEAKRAVIAKK